MKKIGQDFNVSINNVIDSRKIHFVNRIDKDNLGDWLCSPLNYYYEYFSKFNIVRHDIDFIDWHEIKRDDIVIIGGSGMFNVTISFNENINKLLNRCDNVIAWSVGFNTHDKQWFQGNEFPDILINKFKLCTIRDYNHDSKIEYLPCPSVFAFANSNFEIIKRKFGIIEHKDLPINGDFYGIERISNAYSLSEVKNFISTSECIITNSYHMGYWSLLLKKKVIIVDKFSTKFDYYKYRPIFIYTAGKSSKDLQEEIEKAFNEAENYSEAYNEAIELNNEFFSRVKTIIEQLNFPFKNSYQEFYEMSCLKSWNYQDKFKQIEEMSERIENLQSNINNLHDELYSVINEKHDEYYQEMNAIRKGINLIDIIKNIFKNH